MTYQTCPDCGRPIDHDHHQLQLDLYEVIARFLAGYGVEAGIPMPDETSLGELANKLRNDLPEDKPHHDRMMTAAALASHYVWHQLAAQYEMPEVQGHA